jgi:hypothetical protein
MRIVYAYFKNFIGFRDGINLNEVEFDFNPDTTPSTILLLGGNGSGKTTLMSHMQPYASNNDTREFTVIPGEDGIKKINILDVDTLYEITHWYSVNKRNPEKSHEVRSFIIKVLPDGTRTDLNQGGRVTSFAAVLEVELGITKDYFKVGRIGTNVSNFIDLNYSDRKRFISNFLPNIDPYMSINKISGSKLSDIKKIAKFVANEIEKIGDVTSILTEIAQLELVIKSYEERVIGISTEINKSIDIINDAKNRGIITDVTKAPFNKYINLLTVNNAKIKEALTNIQVYLPSYTYVSDAVSERIETLTTLSKNILLELNTNNQKISAFSATMKEKTNSLAVISSKIIAKQNSVNSDSSSTAIISSLKKSNIELVNNLGIVTDELDTITKSLNPKQLDLVSDLTGSKINNANAAISSVRSTFQEYLFKVESASISLITSMSLEELAAESKAVSAELAAIDLKINQREIVFNRLASEKMMLDKFVNLKSLNHSCSSAGCPYEKLINSIDSVSNEFNLVSAELDDLSNERTEIYNSELLFKKTCGIAPRLIKSADDAVKTVYDILGINIEANLIIDFNVLNNINNKNLSLHISLTKRIEDINRQIISNEFAISLANDKHKIIEGLETELTLLKAEELSIKTEITELQLLRSSVTTETMTVSKRYDAALLLVARFEELKKLQSEKDELEIKSNNSETEIQYALEVFNSLVGLNADLHSITTSLNLSRSRLTELKVKYSRYEEHRSTQAGISEKYKALEQIKDATDVTSGIPLFLIKEYLTDIQKATNRLLGLAYNGAFEIADFVLTDSEFLIPIKKHSGITKDITESSQGEVCLTKTALSLSIFEKIMGRYNIPVFDEIDAELDSYNRPIFIDILNNQLERLGIEQSFIISHNNSFYNSSVGIILFNRHSLDVNDKSMMMNKVIFNFISCLRLVNSNLKHILILCSIN